MAKFDDDPWYVSSEQDHGHECPECGSIWLHQNDQCEVIPRSPTYTYAICPDCER